MNRLQLRQLLQGIIIFLIPLLFLIPDPSFFAIPGFTLSHQRMLAILVMALLFWILEPIPIFATSVLIITAELFLISNQSPRWLLLNDGQGMMLKYTEVLASFASPIIILFLGGFFLAIAASKYKLDRNLARILLRPFGQDPKWLMLGLMVITAVFSMFMSNTATTAMMLAILAPVLASFDIDDPARKAFLLCIPLAANVGGIGTPIGTPPNAIALKYLTGEYAVSFAEWMAFGLPYVTILLIFAWLLLIFAFKPKQSRMQVNIEGRFEKNWQAYTVYATFLLTIGLWLSGDFHGMNSYVVAMVPVALFSATGIIGKQDLKKISWDVLWLISGGIDLGYGLESTGLTSTLIAAVPLDSIGGIGIILFFTIMTLLMASFMSNTATANLMLPLIAAIAVNLESLIALGGLQVTVIVVTLTCSIGMALPISTPPNALAYATGELDTKDLMKIGGIVSLFGLLMVYILGAILAFI
ncbi:MAG: SLC13 family permease [Oligoflexus sp.]